MKQMNNPPDFELVDMDIDGPCVHIKINRPDKFNALNVKLILNCVKRLNGLQREVQEQLTQYTMNLANNTSEY